MQIASRFCRPATPNWLSAILYGIAVPGIVGVISLAGIAPKPDGTPRPRRGKLVK
jgi:hypothetical protein